MDYSALIAQRRRRLGEIDDMISDPGFYDDPKRASEVMREHRRIQQTLAMACWCRRKHYHSILN